MLFRCVIILLLLPCLTAAEARPSPPPLSAYGRLPGISEVALSLSGQHLAFVSELAGQRVLLVAATKGGIQHKVGLGDIKVRGLGWAGDDFVVVQTSSTQNLGFAYGGRYELFNVLVLNRLTGETAWPLAHSKKVLNAAFGYYPPVREQGRWYQCLDTLPLEHSSRSGSVWISRFENDLSCIDLQENKLDIVARGRKDGAGWLLGPGRQVLAHATYDDIKQRWQLWGGDSGATLLSGKAPLTEFESRFGGERIIGQGRQPGTVMYARVDSRGGHHIMEAPLSGGAKPIELYADLDVDQLMFDPLSGLHSGYIVDGDVPSLTMLDARAQARIVGTRKAFPQRQVKIRSWSQDLAHLVAFTEGSTDAGTWWLVDIAEGSAVELGRNYPLVKAEQVGPFAMWQYRAADGLPIAAVLTRPPGAEQQNLPLIVMPHGGPEARDRLGFDWLAQAFASRGYVVLQPNFRGSSGYGLAFRDAGFGQWGRKMQSDLSDGVAALAETGLIDADRVCIVGASYGGYAALAGVTLQQGIYRCAVSYAGVAEPTLLMREYEADRIYNAQRYLQDFLGAKHSRDNSLEAISPLAHAKQAGAPVLLIHGSDDLVVPIVHSKKMTRKLKSADKVVEFLKLPGEDHYLSREATRQAMLEATLRFVSEHNPAD